MNNPYCGYPRNPIADSNTTKQPPAIGCIVPNAKTLAAIAEAERGELITVGSVADFITWLNANAPEPRACRQ